jgi:hypothetical protein
MCAHPGVDCDLARVVQKKGETLREFIQRFCNTRNIISEVDDMSIIMFFKKGLRDPSLVRKLAMKNPRTSEAMFAIANKDALAENVTLDTREQKKEKDTAMQTSLAHPRAMTRRGKWIVLSMWWNDHNAIRSTDLGRVNLKASWIASAFSTPREIPRPRTATNSKVSQMKYSRRPKGTIRRKIPKNPRATSPKLTRGSTTSMVAPILMSQGGSRNS